MLQSLKCRLGRAKMSPRTREREAAPPDVRQSRSDKGRIFGAPLCASPRSGHAGLIRRTGPSRFPAGRVGLGRVSPGVLQRGQARRELDKDRPSESRRAHSEAPKSGRSTGGAERLSGLSFLESRLSFYFPLPSMSRLSARSCGGLTSLAAYISPLGQKHPGHSFHCQVYLASWPKQRRDSFQRRIFIA
jgi:hypothetical protein